MNAVVPKSGSFEDASTDSRRMTRPPGFIAFLMFARIFSARSSSQSWMMCFMM